MFKGISHKKLHNALDLLASQSSPQAGNDAMRTIEFTRTTTYSLVKYVRHSQRVALPCVHLSTNVPQGGKFSERLESVQITAAFLGQRSFQIMADAGFHHAAVRKHAVKLMQELDTLDFVNGVAQSLPQPVTYDLQQEFET
ncbi:unnamed protein product [Nesidiocoris tenuis]|uniref:Uncharacterized protein n=1 Tax=Nesidiocoris tenuis TaxID=355587 RepID=A0A6H5GJD7_9HEMI|nr:unnamed protein product [Nesidiocoris tenuis]